MRQEAGPAIKQWAVFKLDNCWVCTYIYIFTSLGTLQQFSKSGEGLWATNYALPPHIGKHGITCDLISGACQSVSIHMASVAMNVIAGAQNKNTSSLRRQCPFSLVSRKLTRTKKYRENLANRSTLITHTEYIEEVGRHNIILVWRNLPLHEKICSDSYETSHI